MVLCYFFLYPDGQVGFTAVTFFDVFPLTQVIVIAFAIGFVAGTVAGAIVGATTGVTGAAAS